MLRCRDLTSTQRARPPGCHAPAGRALRGIGVIRGRTPDREHARRATWVSGWSDCPVTPPRGDRSSVPCGLVGAGDAVAGGQAGAVARRTPSPDAPRSHTEQSSGGRRPTSGPSWSRSVRCGDPAARRVPPPRPGDAGRRARATPDAGPVPRTTTASRHPSGTATGPAGRNPAPRCFRAKRTLSAERLGGRTRVHRRARRRRTRPGCPARDGGVPK